MENEHQGIVNSYYCNEQLYNIFSYKTLSFCLICKETITDGFCLDRHTLVTNHVYSIKHEKRIRGLFKLCIPDPNCNSRDVKYLDIINNSVFDISLLLGSEQSYVYERDQALVCLVCEETSFCAVTADVQVMKDSLITHLESELHQSNIRDNIGWVYRLNIRLDFILFQKYLVYCFVCKKTVIGMENTILQVVVNHLQNVHPLVQHNATIDENSRWNIRCDEMFKKLHLMSVSDSGSPIKANALTNVAEGLADSENISEELNDLYTCNDLTCPECGEFVDIYNDNAEFSMQLHSQKHQDLSSISFALEVNKNTDYVCPVCQETIVIYNNDIELSVNRHFDSSQHDRPFRDYSGDCQNEPDLITNVFDHLSVSCKLHRDFFEMDGNEFFCKLCNCTVPSKKDITSACKALSDHMVNCYHKDQYAALTQHLAMTVVNYNKQKCNEFDSKEQKNIIDLISEKRAIIMKNKHYIERRQVNYFCTLCQKHICYSPNETTLISNFVLHFKNLDHKHAVRDSNKSSNKLQYTKCNIGIEKQCESTSKKYIEDVITKLSEQCLEIYLNGYYLREEKGNFFCDVCKKSIKFSVSGWQLIDHCYSSSHNNKLMTSACIYVSSLEERGIWNSKQNCEKFKAVLKKIAKPLPIESHAYYIRKKNNLQFICLVCNKSLPFTASGKNVKGHIFSPTHLKNTYKVNLSNSLELPKVPKTEMLDNPQQPKDHISQKSLLKESPHVYKKNKNQVHSTKVNTVDKRRK